MKICINTFTGWVGMGYLNELPPSSPAGCRSGGRQGRCINYVLIFSEKNRPHKNALFHLFLYCKSFLRTVKQKSWGHYYVVHEKGVSDDGNFTPESIRKEEYLSKIFHSSCVQRGVQKLWQTKKWIYKYIVNQANNSCSRLCHLPLLGRYAYNM